jgi:hypothetical protein
MRFRKQAPLEVADAARDPPQGNARSHIDGLTYRPALASNPLPWWEKLTMDVSLWVRFTATERRERGAAHRVLIEPSLDDPCTVLWVLACFNP